LHAQFLDQQEVRTVQMQNICQYVVLYQEGSQYTTALYLHWYATQHASLNVAVYWYSIWSLTCGLNNIHIHHLPQKYVKILYTVFTAVTQTKCKRNYTSTAPSHVLTMSTIPHLAMCMHINQLAPGLVHGCVTLRLLTSIFLVLTFTLFCLTPSTMASNCLMNCSLPLAEDMAL